MEGDKISITLDEVNSARVDEEIRRQDIAQRMAAHQEQVENTTPPGRSFAGAFFRKAIVYMALFGLVASLLAWSAGEIFMYKSEHHPWLQATQIVKAYSKNNPNASVRMFINALDNLRYSSNDELKNNPYLQRSFWEQSEWIRTMEFKRGERDYNSLDMWWTILMGLAIGLGLAIAEPAVGHNLGSAIIRGAAGAGLGALGGYVCSLFINDIYHYFGGGGTEFTFQQVFARGVGWSILGAFLAIAPGIAMRNLKKFLLGLAGGAIGGLVGGMLFDPICQLTGSGVPARLVNILGLGVGAAVATAILEEAAKQGWLKVATGIITGKQFILYRNPTVIGSSPKTEIYLFKDPAVAPRHAAINGVGGNFILTALNDATVLLNGKPVRQERLKNGDQIRIGNTIFLFGSRRVNVN